MKAREWTSEGYVAADSKTGVCPLCGGIAVVTEWPDAKEVTCFQCGYFTAYHTATVKKEKRPHNEGWLKLWEKLQDKAEEGETD